MSSTDVQEPLRGASLSASALSASALSASALAALGLQRQPFPEIATDESLFIDPPFTEQLADVRQVLLTGDDLLLLLGERGAGKSTLLARLTADSGLRIQCFSVRGGPRFSTLNLFVGMLEAFKVRPHGQLKESLDELVPCLQAMSDNNTLCVVVLDDADKVAAEELTLLLSSTLYLNNGDESLLRIALAASPAFEERLPDLLPRGAGVPYSTLVLEPFDMHRAGLFLVNRLEQAGLTGEFPFDEPTLKVINERAGGRPGALQMAATAALEARWGDGSDRELDTSDTLSLDGPNAGYTDIVLDADDLPPGHGGGVVTRANRDASNGRTLRLAIGSLAALMILGGLLLFRPAPESGESEARYRLVEARRLETEQLRLLEEERAAEDAAAADTSTATARPSTSVERDDTLATIPTTERPLPPPRAPDLAPTSTVDPPSATSDTGEGPGTVPAPATPAPVIVAESADPSPTDNPPPADDPLADASLAPEPTPEPEPEPDVTLGVAEPEPSGPSTGERAAAGSTADGAELSDLALLGTDETPPESPPAATSTAAPAARSVLESPNWVLFQDEALFTVQMIASSERTAVETFLVESDLPGPNSIFSFDRDGRTWYALVHGLYPSVDEARAAVERMPSSALANQPWIRAVGRIQRAMREQE